MNLPSKSRSAPRDALELNLLQLTSTDTPLLKFGRDGKPGFRNFILSPDFTSLCWQSKNKKSSETKVLIREIKEIRYGQRTEKFKRNNRPDLEHLSFSIVYTDNQNQSDTLDLVCKDEGEFQTWTTTLAALVEGKIDVSAYIQSGSGSGTTGSGYNGLSSTTSPSPSPSSSLWTQSAASPSSSSSSSSSSSPHSHHSHGHGHGAPSLLPQYTPLKIGQYDNSSINVPPPRKKSIKPKISRAAREAFKEANDVYVFGSNVWGELGFATKEKEISQPKLLETMLGKHVVQIACGWSHTVALLEDGSILTYGNRIGSGKEEDGYTPMPMMIPNKEKVEWASCGSFHSCVVTEKGNLFTWGCNFNGQLGHGNRIDSSTPKCVEWFNNPSPSSPSPSFVLLVSCGSNFTCVLNDEGMLFTMGDNSHGQLGLSHLDDCDIPTHVVDLSGTEIIRVSCGHSHVVAVSGNGSECYSWGLNSCGQLGLGHEESVSRPHIIKSLRGQQVKDIDCGAAHTFAIVHQQKLRIDLLYSWGSNMKGQCGHSKKVKVTKPVVVDVTMSHENPFVEVRCGAFHTLVRQQDGSVLSTGDNHCGQLGQSSGMTITQGQSQGQQGQGHGSAADDSSSSPSSSSSSSSFSLKPIDFLQGKGARAVLSGGNQSCVLTSRAWVEDSEAKTCMACAVQFTLLNRKHHCRNCGGIFCHNCSAKKMAVLKFHLTEPVRVCNNCHQMLGGR